VAKKTLKINTKTKRAHNLRGATSTASGHSRAISDTTNPRHEIIRHSFSLESESNSVCSTVAKSKMVFGFD